MKVTVRNLGVIEEANIDLRPFTIFIGPNNAGKTWLAYFALSQENSSSEPDFEREIMFQPTKNSKLEIAIASSMVKELSPLVLYLRYLAEPGELLIIDEPEMRTF